MGWLDLHGSAVQALAAIAGVLVTLGLALLTARYVRLTSAIANAASVQAEYLGSSARALRKESAHALAVFALSLRSPLVGLEASFPSHESLYKYSQLHTSDILTLENLARAVGGDAIVMANKAAVGLRTIYGLIEQARRINLSMGWTLPPAESQGYYDARQAALIQLDDLARYCSQAAV